MKQYCVFGVLLALLPLINCDDLYVVNAPKDAIAFSDKVTSIKASQLGALLNTVAGITPSKASFDGVRVLSPFRYPRVISLVTVDVPEVTLPTSSWHHLDVIGSVDADAAFYQLDKGLAKQPHSLPAIKLQAEQDDALLEDSAAELNSSLPAGHRLLQEISLLDTASERMSSQLEDRRAVLVSLQSLPAAVSEQGTDAGVTEQLAAAVARYAERLSVASGGRAVTLLLTQPAHVRRARSLLAAAADGPTKSSLNLAGNFTGDYPVIFNILLLTSLFLVYVLVFFSIMTAYMDPGKDSIIYRMTNPNMKKNN